MALLSSQGSKEPSMAQDYAQGSPRAEASHGSGHLTNLVACPAPVTAAPTGPWNQTPPHSGKEASEGHKRLQRRAVTSHKDWAGGQALTTSRYFSQEPLQGDPRLWVTLCPHWPSFHSLNLVVLAVAKRGVLKSHPGYGIVYFSFSLGQFCFMYWSISQQAPL